MEIFKGTGLQVILSNLMRLLKLEKHRRDKRQQNTKVK